jgi:excinuclease ABC subunit A
LIEAGGSIIIIEHNLDVIKSADWVIDLGPEGGGEGGAVVAVGPPSAIAERKESHTGRFLRGVLKQ